MQINSKIQATYSFIVVSNEDMQLLQNKVQNHNIIFQYKKLKELISVNITLRNKI